jgi:hypothetical protein
MLSLSRACAVSLPCMLACRQLVAEILQDAVRWFLCYVFLHPAIADAIQAAVRVVLVLDSSSRIKRLIWINKKWIMLSYYPSDRCMPTPTMATTDTALWAKLWCAVVFRGCLDHCTIAGYSSFQTAMSVRKHLYALQTKALTTHSVVSREWNCLRPSWPRHAVDSQSTNVGSTLPRAFATLSRWASCLTCASTTRGWPRTQGAGHVPPLKI